MANKMITSAERACIIERFEELRGTLDGATAYVMGRAGQFAHLVAIRADGTRAEVQYAWPTLRRIVKAGRVTLHSFRWR